MKIRGKKALALVLAFTMLLSSLCVSAIAAQISDGQNGKTIYMSTKATSAKAGAEVSSVESGSNFVVEVNFANNPTVLDDSIQSAGWLLQYDNSKMSVVNVLDGLVKGTYNKNFAANVVFLSFASTDGIYKLNEDTYENEVQASGTIAYVVFKATTKLTAEDLEGFTFLAQSGTTKASIADRNGKDFAVIQTPALSVTVKAGTTLYDTTTAAELKAALEVKSIDKQGNATAVTDFTLDKDTLTKGENQITVTAGGLSETITVTAQEDKVETIAVTTQPKLTYTTGEKLDLSGMVVTATCKSGKTKTVSDYTTSIVGGTELTVTTHNGTKITVSAEGKTAETNALTVNKRSVAIPTAEGEYTYTGGEQSFQLNDSADKAYYEVVVKVGETYVLATSENLKGMAVGTYTAEARLKELGEMAWSDGSTAPKTLTWVIKADTTALTVTVTGADDLTYTGSAQQPTVTVKSGEKSLAADDYTVSYSNNTNAGTATVTVTGKGNYAGAIGTATFQIKPITLTAEDLEFSGSTTKVYDGSTNAPAGLKVAVKSSSLKGSDTVELTGTMAYNSANVADANTITFTANAITTGNYQLAEGVTQTTAGSITAKSVNETRESVSQNIVAGVGTFTEPSFGDITGTVSYNYNSTAYSSAAELANVLKALTKDTTGTIRYTYTANGNYTGSINGEINFTMVDILFTVEGQPAAADNALTIRSNPVYGDDWSDIVKVKNGIVASVGGTSGTGTYTLKETGRPNAGAQNYTIVFNGTVGGKTYTNTPVITGSITVAPKALTVTGLEIVSKSYDGTTAAHLRTDKAQLVGVVPGDTVTLDSTGVTVAFANKEAGVNKSVIFDGSFKLTGTAAGNYTLTQPTGLTGTITAAMLTVTGATAQVRAYDGNTAVQIDSVTFQGVATGESLTIGTDYTATGVLADGPDAGDNKTVNVAVTLLNSNYTLGESTTTTTTVHIKKAQWTTDPGVPREIYRKYGSTFYIDLSGFHDATEYTVPSSDVATFTAELDQERVKVEMGGVDKIGRSTEFAFRVSMKNYNPFLLHIKFTVLDKDTQTLTADPVEKVYGDVFTVSVNGAQTPVTYAVKPGSESYLSYADGKFTALKSGTATIVATAAENDDYKSNSVEIPVTITKREMTVKANDINITVGDTIPALTYTVSGMLPGDSWIKEPILAVKSSKPVDTSEAGEYDIVIVEHRTDPTSIPTGDYDITYVNGKLTVSERPIVIPPMGNAITVDRTTNGRVTASSASAIAGGTITITTTPDQGYELADLQVTDRLGNRLPVADLGNGRFSFVMPGSPVTVSASFAKVQQSGYYADVQPGDWYYDAVQYVTEQGLMGGTGKGFEPSLTTSRAMIWTILARMDGVDTTSAGGSWYAVAQQWAVENGVSDGTDPDGLITREQLAAMLYRYAVSKGIDVSVGEDTNILSYTDALDISEWAFSAMQWACGAGIVNGINDGLVPQGSATRAQTATMLMRYLELVK